MLAERECGEDESFLYEKIDRFESMGDVLWWLPFNYADGYARSVRGVASYMAMHDDLSNRFLCRVFDAGFLSSSILLQPKSQYDLSNLEFARMGPYTILPPELDTIQTSFQPNIAPLIQLRQVSEAVQQNNTGAYRQHPETFEKASAQKTARQVMEESSKEARYEKAAVAHRYDHLDVLYNKMFARLISAAQLEGEGYAGQEEAKDFVKRCKDRGVPQKLLNKWSEKLDVKATRALGLGSPAVRFDLTNQLLQARGMMDERGQVNAFRDWLAARVGYANVDRYRPQVNRNDIPSNEQSIAMLENNDLKEGSTVVAGSDQMHGLHLPSHMENVVGPITEAVQQQQYQDPMRMARVLSVAIQHCSEHLSYLAQDSGRKQMVQESEQFLKQAAGMIPKLQKQAEQMQQQQQAQQQQAQDQQQQAQQVLQDRELEAKIYEINQKSQLERMKQDSLNQMRSDKTEEQNSINRRKAEAQIQLAQEKQDAEIAIQQQGQRPAE
jgi:hypothetical protein